MNDRTLLMLKSIPSRKIWPAWAMLGAGLLATVFATLQVKQGIEQDAVKQFAFTCDQVTLKIQDRLGAYALILRGGAALFAASREVDRQAWRAYVETLRAAGSIPGVQGIGFAQVIPADQLAPHIAHIRGEGFPEYTVSPSGERAIYTSIIYLEPFRDRNLRAFGYDMFSEPVRRAAMEQARDTGEAALSGKVELVQETGTEVQAGTLIYVPVYRNGAPANTVEQRRAALIGWAYSPYRMNDLMGGILANWTSDEGKAIDLHIYDDSLATSATLLFDSKPASVPDLRSLFYQQRTIDFNGHQWLLVFDRASASGIGYADAWATFIGGLALSGLLFGLMLSRINTRANAARIADELTKENRSREEQLRKYKDHLEELVQQRTADLEQALNAAEAANRAKSVFLSSMSHELRTPMNAILGFSSLMRKDPLLSQEQRENLDIINRSGDHLLTLINDVLEMARIEAGRVQIESSPIDLGALVRDVTDMMHVRAEEKELQLLVDQTSEFPRYIMGDEMRLRQVLINLIGNAVKFTPHGGISLRLGVKSHNGLQRLLIEVEDSGIGIKPEDQQKIFEPFVQLGETPSQKGTGLGLTITRQYLLLMGGTISVESTPGKGSTFRVELPLNKVAAADVTKPTSVVRGEIVSLAPNQPEYRILIVEDQLESQLLLAKLMKNVGFPIKVADNGAQAVEIFQDWRPHLIWMDRRMPVMDGLEATRRIRELPGGKEVKIVAVTASAFTEQRDEMLNAGMDEFVRKPYRFNEIYECLTRQLGVQYIYADAGAAEETSNGVLTAEMLAVLPPDLCRELHDALESLEGERIAAVIQQVAPYDLKLHKTLSHLAENFDYPAILKALQTNPPKNAT